MQDEEEIDDDTKKRQLEEALILAGEDPVKLLDSFKTAFSSGSNALKLYFEDDTDMSADKEEDIYNSQPLPFIIGSSIFNASKNGISTAPAEMPSVGDGGPDNSNGRSGSPSNGASNGSANRASVKNTTGYDTSWDGDQASGQYAYAASEMGDDFLDDVSVSGGGGYNSARAPPPPSRPRAGSNESNNSLFADGLPDTSVIEQTVFASILVIEKRRCFLTICGFALR